MELLRQKRLNQTREVTMKLSEFKLEAFFAKHEFTAPYLLSGSDAESHSMEELVNMADAECLTLWKNLRLGYTETPGLPLLREEVSKLYASQGKENILICAGAGELIYISMHTLLNPGDHVVVLTPCYQSLKEVAKGIGAKVTEFNLDFENGQWVFNLEKFASIVTDQTKLIIINFPHNPTGFIPDKSLFNAIIDIAKQHNTYLFSDEVYRLSEQNPQDCLPNAVDCYEKAISIGVMSKSFGLPGLRIGWLATHDKKLLHALTSYRHYTTLCNSAPSEILAIIGLRNKEKILQRNINLAKQNMDLLDQFFSQYPEVYQWYRPKAGFISFPKLKLNINIEQYAEKLISEEGVVILPGTVYDNKNNHFRIGFGRRNMPEALTRFARFTKNMVGE